MGPNWMIPVIDLLVKHTWWNISLASVATQIPLSGEVQTVCQALVASKKVIWSLLLGKFVTHNLWRKSLQKTDHEKSQWMQMPEKKHTSYIFIIFIYHISHFCGTVSTPHVCWLHKSPRLPKPVASRTSNRSSATQTSTWRSEPSDMVVTDGGWIIPGRRDTWLMVPWWS